MRGWTPWDEVEALYDSGRGIRSMMDDIAFHGTVGYIMSTPTCFLMARAVRRDAAPYSMRDSFPLDECDTWLVWAMAGDIREAMQFAPPTMKWIAFAREERLRFHDFNKLRRKLCLSTN